MISGLLVSEQICAMLRRFSINELHTQPRPAAPELERGEGPRYEALRYNQYGVALPFPALLVCTLPLAHSSFIAAASSLLAERSIAASALHIR